jgi:hypothetical protein
VRAARSIRQALVAFLIASAATTGSTARADEEPPALFALIVGVNRSADADLPPLAYADDDALRYHDLFRSLGARTYLLTRPDENTRRVSPQAVAEAREPRRAELDQTLTALATDIRRARGRKVRTAFYFIYAGHGNSSDDETAYLTLEDARISGADIARQIVDAVGADETHVIVDACYSYLLAYGRGPGGRRREVHGFSGFGELARRPTVGLLLSTSSARESHEWEGFQAGVFSHEVRSGLYGAADADGDGRVSYREIAAFVARANAAIPNEQLRPDVFARPPRSSQAIVDLRRGLERRLTVGANVEQAHYLLEDVRGNRLADFHKALGRAVSLLRPTSMGTLFLRRLSDEREFEIPNGPDVVRVDDLMAQPARASRRGAAHHAFNLIFSLPFDESSVRGYALPDDSALLSKSEDATPAWRTPVGVTALVLSAGACALGGALVVGSRSAAEEASAAKSQSRAAELNETVAARNRGAALAFGLGAAAGVAGALLLLWPENREEQSRLNAEVSGDRFLLGVRGTF